MNSAPQPMFCGDNSVFDMLRASCGAATASI